jgi:hypothetical protein
MAAAQNPAWPARADGSQATPQRGASRCSGGRKRPTSQDARRPGQSAARPGCPVSAWASRTLTAAPAGHLSGGTAAGPERDGGIRASDRDRERAVQVLRDAHAEGRLDLGEFMERTSAAYAARTWGELAGLTTDLPPDQRFAPAATGAGSCPELMQARNRPQHPFAVLWPVAIIWLAIAAAAHVAAAIPLILLAIFVLCAACWRVPPADQLRATTRTARLHAASGRAAAPRSPR